MHSTDTTAPPTPKTSKTALPQTCQHCRNHQFIITQLQILKKQIKNKNERILELQSFIARISKMALNGMDGMDGLDGLDGLDGETDQSSICGEIAGDSRKNNRKSSANKKNLTKNIVNNNTNNNKIIANSNNIMNKGKIKINMIGGGSGNSYKNLAFDMQQLQKQNINQHEQSQSENNPMQLTFKNNTYSQHHQISVYRQKINRINSGTNFNSDQSGSGSGSGSGSNSNYNYQNSQSHTNSQTSSHFASSNNNHHHPSLKNLHPYYNINHNYANHNASNFQTVSESQPMQQGSILRICSVSHLEISELLSKRMNQSTNYY